MEILNIVLFLSFGIFGANLALCIFLTPNEARRALNFWLFEGKDRPILAFAFIFLHVFFGFLGSVVAASISLSYVTAPGLQPFYPMWYFPTLYGMGVMLCLTGYLVVIMMSALGWRKQPKFKLELVR